MKNIILMCSFLVSLPGAAWASEFKFELEPYLMLSSIDGDTGVGRVTGTDVDVDFDDILETLELGGMVHFEAHHRNGWGVILDYSFVDLGEDISGPLGGILEASVRQGVLEALVAKRVTVEGGIVDYFAGIRWWDNDIELKVDPAFVPGSTTLSVDQDWVDPVIGARWITGLSERWQFHLRGDVGGFGVGSDFTSTVITGVRYEISSLLDVDVQYKATWVDYEEGTAGQPDSFRYDTVTHGPIVGVNFKF